MGPLLPPLQHRTSVVETSGRILPSVNATITLRDVLVPIKPPDIFSQVLTVFFMLVIMLDRPSNSTCYLLKTEFVSQSGK